jgi:hypothetical protein
VGLGERSLAAHVGVVLAAAAVVFGVAATLLWVALGSPAPQRDRLAPADQLELVKIALATVAGVGGVVALVVAYRRQQLLEEGNRRDRAAELRDNARLFSERLTAAGTQLGHANPAVRLAGIYGFIALADDATTDSQRQSAISTLCAYLRLPYRDGPGDGEETVRRAVLTSMASHLRPRATRPAEIATWQGYAFNLGGAVLAGAALAGIVMRERTYLNLSGCRVDGGTLDLGGIRVQGGALDLREIVVADGAALSFREASFESGRLLLDGARCEDRVDAAGVTFAAGFEVSADGADVTPSTWS